MPGRDRKLGPDGDYLPDGKGSYQTTTDLSTAVRHQLQGERNRWVGDPDAGSLLYTLERARNSAATSQKAQDIVKQAMQPFLDLGLATKLETIVDRDVGGRFGLSSTLHDLQHGEIDISDLLPGGP